MRRFSEGGKYEPCRNLPTYLIGKSMTEFDRRVLTKCLLPLLL